VLKKYSYPRANRLLTPEDFQRIFNAVDCKVSNSYLLLLVKVNKQKIPRIGFIFSKKKIKYAVHRNRIKRLTREYFRLHQSKLPSIDIVILAKKGVGDIDNKIYQKEFEILFNRLIKKTHQLLNLNKS